MAEPRYTPAGVPVAPKWRAPFAAALRGSRLYMERRIDNRAPLEQLYGRDLPTEPDREFFVALVPGCSEAKGHHKAWVAPANDDDDRPALVEPEYRARLSHGYRLLEAEVVQYVIVSGGSIDAAAPDYNEGLRGQAQLLVDHEGDWKQAPASRGDPLARRIITDPYAIHSTSNVRNADRVCALLGLDRCLVVTTQGAMKQGGWFTIEWPLGSFEQMCQSQLGYRLGEFVPISPGPDGANVFGTGRDDDPAVREAVATEVICHFGFPSDRLLADPRWE